MKDILSISVLLLASISIYAQEGLFINESQTNLHFEKYNCSKQHKHLNLLSAEDGHVEYRPYDVLEYDLYMNWYNPLKAESINDHGRFFTGINKIRIRIDSAEATSLKFNAGNMEITSVRFNLTDLDESSYEQVDEYLIINPENPMVKDEEVELEIHYRYTGESNLGFYLYEKDSFVGIAYLPAGKQDTLFSPERIAYTMSEPNETRYWMPCNDYPYDKALSSIAVTVPKGFTVASNGLLTDQVIEGDSATFYWKSQYPMATYLMHAIASKYVFWKDEYVKVSDPLDTIDIEYYAWEQDTLFSEQAVPRAKFAFRNMPDMMKFFSESYGEYPFEKYGMAVAGPFDFGGMEHQTISTIHQRWIYGYSESGIAHELAHQWIGDEITCATWNDLWINEGGATWSEAIWAEHINDNEGAYYQSLLRNRFYYLIDVSTHNRAIRGLPLNDLFGRAYELTYFKSAWVYHMLSEMAGRDNFLYALRKTIEDYSMQSVTTKDFTASLIKYLPEMPVDINVWFDQWLNFSGHPRFSLETMTIPLESGGFEVKVNIDQVQNFDGGPDFFTVPLKLDFLNNSALISSEHVIMDNKSGEFTVYLDEAPDSVSVDMTKILGEQIINVVSVNELNAADSEFRLYPNPMNKGEVLNIEFPSPLKAKVIITLHDMTGKKLSELYSGTIGKGKYSFPLKTDRISRGIYYIRISGNNIHYTGKFTLIE
ncbi:MAG: M1 family aminopeptidase [Candidatus Kapaibacterium sp.]